VRSTTARGRFVVGPIVAAAAPGWNGALHHAATGSEADHVHLRGDTRLWHPFAEMGAVRRSELVIERGEGVWVFDAGGRRLLDATASLWYANVGHGRTEIHRAVAEQFARLEAYSTFGDICTPPALELAERLARLAPVPDARVFLASGGGDAIDTAAKLARRYFHAIGRPERVHLITRANAYHGSHGFGTAIAGIPANRAGHGPLLEDAAVVAYDSVPALREEIQRAGEDRVAAFFLEPVIGSGGVLHPPPGYIEEVAQVCRDAGVLFVVDAVICGFGRLGTWFGIERWDVVPDIVCFAKGVTSGYLPLGGAVVSGAVAEPFWADGGPAFRHGATYAGHAACCAAALANLDILEREGLVRRGAELESDLYDALAGLQGRPGIAAVRGGLGLLAAVELGPDLLAEDPRAVIRIAELAREAGVIVRPLGAAVAVSPPLTATPAHFALIEQALQHAFATVERDGAGSHREPAAVNGD
jgi:adenosylmethionine-8-amino-7-oxononanoate aminotransferase